MNDTTEAPMNSTDKPLTSAELAAITCPCGQAPEHITHEYVTTTSYGPPAPWPSVGDHKDLTL